MFLFLRSGSVCLSCRHQEANTKPQQLVCQWSQLKLLCAGCYCDYWLLLQQSQEMCWILQIKGKPLSRITSKNIFIYYIGICQPVGRIMLLCWLFFLYERVCALCLQIYLNFRSISSLCCPLVAAHITERFIYYFAFRGQFYLRMSHESVFAALLWSELVQALSQLCPETWAQQAVIIRAKRTNCSSASAACELPSSCSFLPSRSDFLLGCFNSLGCLKSVV